MLGLVMDTPRKAYEVIVVGGGHAGCEAALAAARMGCYSLLITFRIDGIGAMSCNPAIGGIAKGQVAREIDALGGEMGVNTDKTAIHFRMLNGSKGPAVRSPRAQTDRHAYARSMQQVLLAQPRLDILAAEVVELLFDGKRAIGVKTSAGNDYYAQAVVLTTGTFMNGLLHFGMSSSAGGRVEDKASIGLSESLRAAGLNLIRLKTGTTPRLKRDSIDWSRLQPQPGDEPTQRFSFRDSPPIENKVLCYITHTTETTHRHILGGLDRSPLYSGKITSVGPRYCPSIEDKVVRFPDRSRHQIFLEPESLETDWIYPNGISTSLPVDVQEAFVRTIPGLEAAEIIRPGYAVEYDCVVPTQLRHTLETRAIARLYCAGQINGTSGYEEAGGQGLLAGINAALAVQGRPPLVLGRHEAYIGVMIDDLVTRGVDEPYRLFTSRAEHRLLLRQDNADLRLTRYGHACGLISDEDMARVRDLERAIDAERVRLQSTRVRPPVDWRAESPSAATLQILLRRPDVTYDDLATLDPASANVPARVREQASIEVVYAGYIERQRHAAERLAAREAERIPEDFDYASLSGLSNEGRGKLLAVRPATLGQAARIPGLTPADLALLLIALRRRQRQEPIEQEAAR